MKLSSSYKTFFKFLITVVLICAIYFSGYLVGHKNLQFEKNYIPKITNIDLGKTQDVDFSLFWDAWNIVKEKYIGSSDSQKMLYGSISGMVNSLGDPYSLFMDPAETKRFSENMNGSFDGIGAEIENKDEQLTIVAPLEGSPAEQAGIEPQDVIVKIDGQNTSELGFYEAIDKIRGKKGTEVSLTIFRKGWNETKDFKVKRDTIVVKSVKSEIREGYTYIKINQFGDDTLDLMKKAMADAQKNNAKGYVIDLRSNPGGYLQDAVDIASMFLGKGSVVVKEEDKYQNKQETKTTLDKLTDKKLVVLVNGGSASASEIFAGAMKDNKRGTIIGEKTFGKGSVQTLEDLKDGSKVRVTIAKWLTPNGISINKEGITPDIEIKMSDNDVKNDNDPQLDRALEEVKK